jgi:hypothetical protein
VIELSVLPARVVAGRPCPLVLRLRNVDAGACPEVRLDLRLPPGMSIVHGTRTVRVPRIGGRETHDHPVAVRIKEAGQHVLQVDLEFVDAEGRLRRTSEDLVVDADPAPPPEPSPPARRGRRGSVFVSYRHADTGTTVGRLGAALHRAFPDRVFHDHTSLAPGDLFAPRIRREIAESALVLVIIGPTWLTARHEGGRPSLEVEDDFVRWEIVTALAADVDIVPVLVDDTALPRAEQLPAPLRPVLARHVHRMSSDPSGIDALVVALRCVLGDA